MLCLSITIVLPCRQRAKSPHPRDLPQTPGVDKSAGDCRGDSRPHRSSRIRKDRSQWIRSRNIPLPSSPRNTRKSGALFVLPPDNNPLVELANPVSRPLVSSWRESHPLTRYVNFALFRPAFSRPLRPQDSRRDNHREPRGTTVFAAERRGASPTGLGIRYFPLSRAEKIYRCRFSRLIFLDWFFHGSGAKDRATGAPLDFRYMQQGNFLLTPKGDKITLNPGVSNFPATYFQGIYQVDRGAQRELFAVNLKNNSESDLRNQLQ